LDGFFGSLIACGDESGDVYRVDCVNDDAGNMDCECFNIYYP
jgi:hypothetical protein